MNSPCLPRPSTGEVRTDGGTGTVSGAGECFTAGFMGLVGCRKCGAPKTRSSARRRMTLPHVEAKPPSVSLLASLDPRAAHRSAHHRDRPADAHGTGPDSHGAGRRRPAAARTAHQWELAGPRRHRHGRRHGRLLFGGEKSDDHHAVSLHRTLRASRQPRQSRRPDFTIGHGQSWCVVTSARRAKPASPPTPEGRRRCEPCRRDPALVRRRLDAPRPSAGAPGAAAVPRRQCFPPRRPPAAGRLRRPLPHPRRAAGSVPALAGRRTSSSYQQHRRRPSRRFGDSRAVRAVPASPSSC